jgi:hypothetical protein
MAISNTTAPITVRTKVQITEVRIAKNADDSKYWQCPVETIKTNDGTSEVISQSATSFTVQHAQMTARIAGLNAQLAAILVALEAEYIAQNP